MTSSSTETSSSAEKATSTEHLSEKTKEGSEENVNNFSSSVKKNIPIGTDWASPQQHLTYGEELLQAYKYAYSLGITTIDNIDNAKMYSNLTRAQAAKMLSQFSMQVLGKTPDLSKNCEYPDVHGQGDLTERMKTSCQLGLMGVGVPTFNPNATMTRAEFGTVLSRALWGNTYEQQEGNYYTTHLQQLQKAGIMNNISTPSSKEVRGYVMLMLMRTGQEVL